MIKSQVNDLLGIEYPIIQGGMAWVADASLASAVSNGGGLGLIAAMNANSDWLREEIHKAKQLTDKVFGVNIMLMSPFADDIAKLVVEENIKVVTTGAGTPTKYMESWLKAGIKVLPVVPSIAVAKIVVKRGACAVIAEGGESGGHVGDLTTMTLVPQICDVVDVPVLAAGGIADGRGVAAAFMLGAQGVQVGTRFLVADECTIHENYKNKIIKARDIDTIVTGKRFGHPVRALKTCFTREFADREYIGTTTEEEINKFGAGALRLAAREGDLQNGCFMAGQSAALVTKMQSASEIIKEMFEQAESILRSSCQWLK